ncbi:phage distal tail protein [Cellulosimicrobium funkei]|uniref:phage distal tail protein n=1 Tax=Cellulosimicrobium funkei TaxID=264251 RepID=UPI0036BB515D
MSFFILASVRKVPPPAVRPSLDTRRLWFESMDGTTVLPIAAPDHAGALRMLKGSQGLGVAPSELAVAGTPGVEGGFVEDVISTERPVVIPMSVLTRTQAEQWAIVQALRDLTDPTDEMTPDGNFKLVADTASGRRELTLAYVSGLEGDSMDLAHYDRIVLQALAVQPFALDREAVRRPFPLGTAEPFLSSGPGTDLPWGTRQLAPSTVIGEGMRVQMTSGRPFYPTIELRGPATSATITSSTGLSIHVPGAIPPGQTLRIVTDPRQKSIRLDGALAAGRVARGSRFAPFCPGENLLDVVVPGATSQTLLTLEWRGRHRSMW